MTNNLNTINAGEKIVSIDRTGYTIEALDAHGWVRVQWSDLSICWVHLSAILAGDYTIDPDGEYYRNAY